MHMHVAWLRLLHAELEMAGVNYRYRARHNPRLYVKVDGEPKTWDLHECMKHRWPNPQDPVRANIDLTVRLRNKIEHRHERALQVAAAGFTQALIVNYEEEVVTEFGPAYSIASLVHLPISLSTFSREGVASLVKAQMSLPRRLRDFFIGYRSGLDQKVVDDSRFELRVEIIQKRGPKSEADLAVTFVREDDLSPEELNAYQELERTGRIILREKVRPVANLGKLRPSALCSLVEAAIPFKFRASSEFPQAWKHFRVRPLKSATGTERNKTDERYCVYDEPHGDYLYTRAFAALVIEGCATEEGFKKIVGRPPRLKGLQSDQIALAAQSQSDDA
jgi:hypothetical protein